ncbi:MAG: uracil-DNA glycosylase [Patescibacteria group bacterium]
MNAASIKLEPSWKKALGEEFARPYFQELSSFVRQEYLTKSIYPAPTDVFRAFEMCPFNQVKVVILGQDPYHGERQANGLSFAVHTGIPLPPSLRNIFKEIQADTGITPLPDGDLSRWATQGVLLLNATLTVQASSPGSHQNKGWELFTDAVIRTLSDQKEHLVFILWGNYAKNKGALINREKHHVIESPHPSPFSAHNGFFGSKPFSKTNAYLASQGYTEIDWR